MKLLCNTSLAKLLFVFCSACSVCLIEHGHLIHGNMAAPREKHVHADSDAELSQSPGGSITEELRAARRSRIACKGWLTRASDSLVKVVSGYDTETHDVLISVDAIDEFDRRLSRFDEAQSSVELLINEDLAQDITNSSDFRNSCKEFRLKAASLLKRIEGNANFKNSTVASSEHANYVTLPKINYHILKVTF